MTDTARVTAKKVFGKYRGFVVDNEDPLKIGRLKLLIPSLLGEQISDWALPCLPFGGLEGHGFFAIPEVDAQVWVEFEAGDLSFPIWVGTFWQSENQAPATSSPPTTRVFKTPSGHELRFEDKEDEERILLMHKDEAVVDFNPEGGIAITDSGGATLVLDAENNEIKLEDSNGNSLIMTSGGTTVEDANGNKVEMNATGVKVSGMKIVLDGQQVFLAGEGGEPVLKGASFLAAFATHVHTTTLPGNPTTPPMVPPPPNVLSMKVFSG